MGRSIFQTGKVIDIQWTPRARYRIRTVTGALEDAIETMPKRFARRGLPKVRKFVRQAFTTEGESQGDPWAQLTPRYAARKLFTIGYQKILQRSGRMRRSLISKSDPEQVVIITASEVKFGSLTPYFGFHQEGTRKMAARPPVKLSDAQLQELGEIIAEDMEKAVDRAVKRAK